MFILVASKLCDYIYFFLGNMETMLKQIRVILFDLGGVLVELNDISTLLPVNGDPILMNTLGSDWLYSPAARDFEKGVSSIEQFADTYIEEKNLPVRRSDFLNAFAQLLDLLKFDKRRIENEYRKEIEIQPSEKTEV